MNAFACATQKIFFGLFFIISQAASSTAQEVTEADIKAVVVELNKGLPLMIDEDIRVDRIEAGYGEAVYFYTFVNDTYDQIDWKIATELMLETAANYYCNSPVLVPFRENGVSMLYIYYDKNGDLVGTIKIPNTICTE